MGSPKQALDMVQNTNGMVYVSQASLWELTIKASRGSLILNLPRFCERVIADGFTWLPIENAHILTIEHLPQFADHKDPFDRLLVAQSICEPLILLTADKKLARYGNTIKLI